MPGGLSYSGLAKLSQVGVQVPLTMWAAPCRCMAGSGKSHARFSSCAHLAQNGIQECSVALAWPSHMPGT